MPTNAARGTYGTYMASFPSECEPPLLATHSTHTQKHMFSHTWLQLSTSPGNVLDATFLETMGPSVSKRKCACGMQRSEGYSTYGKATVLLRIERLRHATQCARSHMKTESHAPVKNACCMQHTDTTRDSIKTAIPQRRSIQH